VTIVRSHAFVLGTLTALGAFAPGAVGAQSSLGVATGELRAPGQPGTGVLTLAPQIGVRAKQLQIWSAGQFSIGSTGNTRSAIESVVSTRAPLLFGLTPMLVLRGQDDPLIADGRNRRVDGAFGVRVGSARLGATAAAGRAQSVHGTTSRSVQTTSADVHVARGGFQFRIAYTGNAFDAAGVMPGGQSGFALARTRLSDITSDGSWKFRRFEIGGFVGRRVGGTDEHNTTWGGGFAALALTDRLAIVARQETAPSDPTRHLAAQRTSTLGFRIRPSLSRARFDDGSDAGQFRREFVLTRLEGSTHGIRVYHPDAAQVEIAGSFNGWSAAQMRRAGGGWWELLVPLASGIHSLNVRADGGAWTVPPGLQTATDEFSGTVGVIVIP
jgi:Glycogen recognition site of AMP-activated protein kinase